MTKCCATFFYYLYEHVIFSFLNYDKKLENEAYIINLLITLLSFIFIVVNSAIRNLFFSVVLMELDIYISTIKESKSKKAEKNCVFIWYT